MFAKQKEACHIRVMMRPVHVTYRTSTQRNSLERTYIPWLLLSTPFLSLKFRSQTNLGSGSEKQKNTQQYQPATYNFSFWGEK